MRECGNLLWLLLCCSCWYTGSGFVVQEMIDCSFENNETATFHYSLTFNRMTVVAYDATRQKFTYCDPYPCIKQIYMVAAGIAKKLNNKPGIVTRMQQEKSKCQAQVKEFWENTMERRVQPSMKVFLPDIVHEGSIPHLVCHVWGFYPADIVVLWLLNDTILVKNYTNAVPVGDWTYQIVALLDMRGSLPENKYTCVVQHSSLQDPMTEDWSYGLTSNQIKKISIATVVFVLGLVTLIAGFVLWRNAKKSGYIPIPGYNEGN
ncbi:hypothetical protein XELAEV_18042429mg [Xenopus laevis]|uniref:Ig-like domain-containing protein n=2 Tax=Xenopus laevis TaxID=8355 RepID=A0A974C405_XENLA|nr:class II MHC DM beta [Xenopus laevis]OCT66172.1 hypothetical protein XELAEV_18042429mg [Xenopus laevis]